MSLGRKGKKILRESNYRKIREELLIDITESINFEGVHGDKITYHIQKALEKENHFEFKRELVDKIKEELDLNEAEAENALLVMIQEDIRKELEDDIYTHSEKRGEIIPGKVYKKGKQKKIWDDVRSIVLGKETSSLGDMMLLLREHSIIRWTLLIGFGLLTISSILLESIYKAIIAGLTLTAESGETLRIMIGNITGALGGILLFFVFISLIIQDKYLARTRDERLRKLADKTLKEKFEK